MRAGPWLPGSVALAGTLGGAALPKFRTNKIKHQHTIIPGLRAALEAMAACPAIHALIPGPIRPHHTPHGIAITLQYETETGWKLLGRNGSAIQEVFIVADDREAARRWLVERGLVTDRESPTGGDGTGDQPPGVRGGKAAGAGAGKAVVLQFEQSCTACGRVLRAGSRAVRRGRGAGAVYLHTRCARP